MNEIKIKKINETIKISNENHSIRMYITYCNDKSKNIIELRNNKDENFVFKNTVENLDIWDSVIELMREGIDCCKGSVNKID